MREGDHRYTDRDPRGEGRALEEKEVAVRNAEAALKEKEDSLSSLEEAAWVQHEEA